MPSKIMNQLRVSMNMKQNKKHGTADVAAEKLL